MNEVLVNFYGHKNLVAEGNLSLHEGEYALNIKSKVYSRYMTGEENELAYDNCKETFFDMTSLIASTYGFAGLSVEGRSGGWLKPISSITESRTIKGTYDEYISFEEKILQEKIWSCFELIKRTQNDLEKIYKFSNNLEEVNKLINEYHQGKTY